MSLAAVSLSCHCSHYTVLPLHSTTAAVALLVFVTDTLQLTLSDRCCLSDTNSFEHKAALFDQVDTQKSARIQQLDERLHGL
jgi:hypothetical protein